MREEERGRDLLSCFDHALLFLTSQHLLADWTGLLPVKVKHGLFSVFHPAAMLWIGGKSGQKKVIETPHVSEWARCILENPCYGRGLGLALSCSLAPGSGWSDASHPVTLGSCRESKHSALVAGGLGSAGSGVRGASRESKRASHLEQDLSGQWQWQQRANLIFCLCGWSSVVKAARAVLLCFSFRRYWSNGL